MPLTEPDLWISHIRLFGLPPETWKARVEIVYDTRSRKGVVVEILVELGPTHPSFLTSPFQAFVKLFHRMMVEIPNRAGVSTHSVILVMPVELGSQFRPPLLGVRSTSSRLRIVADEPLSHNFAWLVTSPYVWFYSMLVANLYMGRIILLRSPVTAFE